MKILLITICYNEEKMLPHFIEYYSQYCDKMIFCDGGSTDKTQEIIKNNHKCELNLDYVSDKADDSTFLEIKNNLWKQHREEYDWCIVVDVDEFLFSFDGLDKMFDESDAREACVILPEGYDMYSEKLLKEDCILFYDYPKGIPSKVSSKMCAFNIQRLDSINYSAGCHIANPIDMEGKPALCMINKSILMHYRYIGLGDILQKKHLAESRLSESNKANGWGIHNTFSDDKWIEDFNTNLKNSKNVL